MEPTQSWLLLIHQIPPKPNYLRVKIWRRLQQVGAVTIKPSVYALPRSDQSREDFSWILKEIMAGGGDGSISEARFAEGLSDEQVVAMFQAARRPDYEKFIEEAGLLLEEWSQDGTDPRHPAMKGLAQVARLRQRLEEIMAVDFFEAPERRAAQGLLRDLSAQLSRQTAPAGAGGEALADLKNKVWVTRANVFVDRLACAWLIRRFVDKGARFKFVSDSNYIPEPGEVRFDMFEAEFTHEGDACTFEVMIGRLGFGDPALIAVAEMVHDIDLKDGKYGRNQTEGFQALLIGLVTTHSEDQDRLAMGLDLYENLYAYFRRSRAA